MCRRREFKHLLQPRWFRCVTFVQRTSLEVTSWFTPLSSAFSALFSVRFFCLGGPVHFESEHRLFVVGVLSGGLARRDRPNAVSYSTLVQPYLEWIDIKIEHERCILKEFGPLRMILLALIISATCFFLGLYTFYLVRVNKYPEKENPKWPVVIIHTARRMRRWTCLGSVFALNRGHKICESTVF